MKNYIVKIREYDNSGLLSYGTGIVIGNGTAILTAAHVICGSKHCVIVVSEKGEVEIETQLLQKNKVAAILSANSSLHCESANIFSNQEIFDDDISWSAEGYITDEQSAHEITGKGVVRSKYHDEVWDCELGGITSGNSQNYRGMSGTPVISCNRIVGILQIQTPLERGTLGLKMSSVGMFQDILPQDSLAANEYETLLFERSRHESILRVKQNKESGKYIPNIFVEENDCKENLRYFADPLLFLKKAVRDCRNIDFSRQNTQLGALQKKLIDVSMLAEPDSLDDVSATQQTVLAFLNYAKESLEFLSNDTPGREIPGEDYWSQWSRNYNSIPFFAGDLLKNVEAAGASFALLTKRAGQGKTNLLCDFTENFLLKKNYCVWYYNAYELRESPMEYLKREWSIDGRYSLGYAHRILEQRWHRTGRPIVLVIDGLNENVSIPDFGQCMYDFLRECFAYPYLKVIMTTREELLDDRFGQLLKMKDSKHFIHVPIWHSSDDFENRIFEGYLNFFDVDIRRDTLTHDIYRTLTDDILLLRFFCEVEAHKRQVYMYNIYKYEVFQQYLDKKAEEYQRLGDIDTKELYFNLLNHICQKMIEQQIFFQLPVVGFDQSEQQLLNRMLENDVIFKGEVQVERGLRTRVSTSISFTFDEFRDFCVTNYFLESIKDEVSFREMWDELHSENPTICEGVERYCFCLAITKYQSNLLPWLQKCPQYESLYWDNVWNIEDRYLTASDAKMWKEQLVRGGIHATSVIRHLLGRRDREYFKIANIGLLFDTMDDMLLDMGMYTGFICQMFAIGTKRRGSLVKYGEGKVCAYDKFLSALNAILKHSNCQYVLRRIDFFRLSVYLYELFPQGTDEIWDIFFSQHPALALSLLKEMFEHPRSLIRDNVADILSNLRALHGNDPELASFDLSSYEREVSQQFRTICSQISEIFD